MNRLVLVTAFMWLFSIVFILVGSILFSLYKLSTGVPY